MQFKRNFFKFLTNTGQRCHFKFPGPTKFTNFEQISVDEEFFNTEVGEMGATLWPYVER